MTLDEIPALQAALQTEFGDIRVEPYGRGVIARMTTHDGVWSFATPSTMDIAALSMAEWRHRFATMLAQRLP